MLSGSRRTGLDVRDETSVNAFFSGPVDAAVACSAVSVDALFVEITPDAITHVIDTNLNGAFLFARAAIHHGATSIVFVGSLSQLGAPRNAVYSASKAGLVGLMRAMTVEYSHVRTNVLVSGFVVTPMTISLPRRIGRRVRDATPLGRSI